MARRRVTWPLRLYAGLLLALLAVNAAGFAVGEVLRRMGPVPLGESITYSTLVTGRDGRLLRPFLTRDGYWRLPVTAGPRREPAFDRLDQPNDNTRPDCQVAPPAAR